MRPSAPPRRRPSSRRWPRRSSATPPTSTTDDVRARARWVVRVTVSLLAMPGRDRVEERALLERFLVPVILDAPAPAWDSADVS